MSGVKGKSGVYLRTKSMRENIRLAHIGIENKNKGILSHTAKLTEEQVFSIRKSNATYQSLAEQVIKDNDGNYMYERSQE